MDNLYTMIQKTHWNEVESLFYQFYVFKDEEEDIKSYKRLIWKLNNANPPSYDTPVSFSFFDEIEEIEEEENYSLAYEYIPVSELIANKNEEDWERFLSFVVEENGSQSSPSEVIVHTLFEFLHDETL